MALAGMGLLTAPLPSLRPAAAVQSDVGPFIIMPVLSRPPAFLVAAMIGAGLAGTLSGRQVLRHTPPARFRLIVIAVLLLLAGRLIMDAVAAS